MNNDANSTDDTKKSRRGWNLRAKKGKKADRDSPSFQKWLMNQRATQHKNDRKRLEALAKAPLPGRHYKKLSK